uniref:Uncharacterized protein n=1 Tax=Babesia bovis TaxID=5865 RepID=A7ART7_BABBO|eukprot:XP_001610824.1 hypothetical protein [Babesia bovis T2Bo]
MSYAIRVLWAVVLVLLLNLYGAAPRAALRQNYLAYSVLKPYLRKPKVRNRTTREEKTRRSAFHKQLHKELRMKYWERLDPAVNTIINYNSKTDSGPVIDPKRAFVVQEVIPQLVKLENQQVNCTLTAEQSESFDRRAGLKLYCDIKAVFSTIADNINNNDVFTDFHLMASQDQLLKLQADVDYIMPLVNAREEPEPSTECIEYCNHIEQLAHEEPIRLASN